jgi:hypothetical protein
MQEIQMSRKKSGSGAATAAGITFQENVAAWLVCQILAGPNRTNDLELPANEMLETITCESLQPIDDIVVGATQRRLYFQCKTSLDIGTNTEFVKVMRQFAEQFIKSGNANDRYILAVSDTASATLRNSISKVLKIVRGKRGDEREQALVNRDQKTTEKFGAFEQTAREQLQMLQNGKQVDHEDVLLLLDRILVYAAPFGAGACIPDAAIDKLALVLTKPEVANRAWEHIVSIVRGFSPNRTGGGREEFVRDLREEGFIAQPLAKVREAIASLRAISDDYLTKLARHASIQCEDRRAVPIKRPIVDSILSELRVGSLLLCGEAGAGKTGCMVQVACRLQEDNIPLIIIPVERAFLGGIQNLLPPGVSLKEVLSAWPTDQPGVVCLDGLDAARSSVSLRSVLDFVYQVQTVAPNWRILASIREYDLHKSDEIRRLFPGSVSSGVPSSDVSGVRSVRIPELTDAETAQLFSSVPTLETVLEHEESSDLKLLARNIFNLDLLVDLLISSVDQNELRRINTQDKLLETYWKKRVDEAANSTEPLTRLTQRMVDSRGLAVNVQTELTSELAVLFSNSVLTREPGPLPEDPELVRYRHNILFDYAISRLWLRGLNDPRVLAEVATSPDLAIVFRPSLRMTLQRLWRVDSTRNTFWTRVAAWYRTHGMNDICKLSLTQVAAEEFRAVRDVTPLLDQLSDTAIVDLLQRTITTALLLLRVNREVFDIVGRDAAEWLPLTQAIAEHDASRFSNTLRNVLAAILDGTPDGRNKLTPEQRGPFSFIARRLLDIYISDPSDHILRRETLGVAIRACVFAVSWDRTESVASLQRAITPEFLAKASFIVLPLLGDDITMLANHDELFVEQVFSSYAELPEPSSNRVTSMGSGSILSLTSTAAQDLSMFEYSVGEVFSELVESHPRLAARVMRLILRRHLANRESNPTEPLSSRTTEFEFEGKQRIYIRDHSYIWDSNQTHSQHNLWRKAADAVFARLKMETSTESVHASLFEELLSTADIGAIWNRLLLAGAEMPAAFGRRLAPLLSYPVFLREFETRYAVGQLLERRFATWDQDARKQVELAIMQIGRGNDKFRNNSEEAAERARNSLTVCLPRAAIMSDELRASADRLNSEQSASPPTVPFGIGKFGYVSEEEDLSERGLLGTDAQKRFFEIRDVVKRLGSSNEAIPVDEVRYALEKIAAYEDALATAESDLIATEQTQESEGEIAAVFSNLAKVEGAETCLRDVILQRLLRFTTHVQPSFNAMDDNCWDSESPHWGSPYPRLEAARGIVKFVRHSKEVDESTADAIRRLSEDTVAAVRYQILAELGNLYLVAPNLFWELIESTVAKEEKLALLQCVIFVLLRFPPNSEHADRVDRLIRRVESRLKNHASAGFVRKTMVVHFLRRSLYVGDEFANSWLDALIESPATASEELHELIRLWQELLSEPPSTNLLNADAIVARGIEVLSRAFDSSIAAWHGRPWGGLRDEEARAAFHRATGPMRQIVDTTSFLLDRRSHPTEPAPRSDYQRIHEMLKTFRPLIDRSATVPLPQEAYGFLRTLQYVSPVNPNDALLWVRTLVRSASERGFLNDYLGADLLIDLLERYLVEHRDLLSGNATVRGAMIDLLNDCVSNGWPKAAPLLMRLHEVFRA